MTDKVNSVTGVDISDQRESKDKNLSSFKLIVYDGYNLE